MAYASGQVIAATDYNGLAQTTVGGNVAFVLGTGHGAVGYGQNTAGIATVSSTATVTATQWSGLIFLVNRALGHQSGAGAQLGSGSNIGVAAGATITAFSNVATAVTTINTNSALASALGSTTTGAASTAFAPNVGATTAFNGHIDVNVTFASANQARFFFNAGGRLNFVCSATGTVSTRTTAMRDAINSIGGITAFSNTVNGGRTGTGGTYTGNTGIGYRGLTTSAQQIAQVTTAAPYGTNFARVLVFCNTSDTTNGSISASVVFRLLLNVAADDSFGGSLTLATNVRCDVVFPSTTYLTDSWGVPTITYDQV